MTPAAGTPPKLTLELLVKPMPLILTAFPAGPAAGLKDTSDSVGLNFVLSVIVPAGVVTEILPAFALFGTVASIAVGESTVNCAASAPN